MATTSKRRHRPFACLRTALPPAIRERVAALYALALGDGGDFRTANDVLTGALVSASAAGRALPLWVRADLAWLAGDLAGATRDAALALAGPRPIDALAAVTGHWSAAEANTPASPPAPFVPYGGTQLELDGLHHATDHPPQAARYFAHAAQRWHNWQQRAVLRCQWAEAHALARAGDLNSAAERLKAVHDRAERLGFAALVPRIQKSLRLTGRRPPPVGKTVPVDAAPTQGPVTAREREVLALVGEGLSGPAIARRLQMSEHTVDKHVRNAKLKLGVANRTEAVAALFGSTTALASPGAAPIIVVDDERSARRASSALTNAGFHVQHGFAVGGDDYDLHASRLVCEGAAPDDRTRSQAIAVGARGAGLVVIAAAQSPAEVDDAFIGDLDKLACSRGLPGVDCRNVAATNDPARLSEDMTALLALLAAGHTVASAARARNLSLRNAHRRLAAARHLLGAPNNRAAIVEFGRRGAH